MLDDVEHLEGDDIGDTLNARCETFQEDVTKWRAVSDACFAPFVDEAIRVAEAKKGEEVTKRATEKGKRKADVTGTADRAPTAYSPLRDSSDDVGLPSDGLPPVRDPKRVPAMWHTLMDTRILLPSSYVTEVRTHNLVSGAAALEFDLRKVETERSLEELRTTIISGEVLKMNKQESTRKTVTTRIQAKIEMANHQIRKAANQYRRSWVLMTALGLERDNPWFRPLKESDVTKFALSTDTADLGKSKRKESWIWAGLSAADVKDQSEENARYQGFYDDGESPRDCTWISGLTDIAARRVHWFRSSALCNRWSEEVRLLEEEMRRTLRFFGYFREKWDEIAREQEQAAELGRAAYARK